MKKSPAVMAVVIAAVFEHGCATTQRGALEAMSQSQEVSPAVTRAPLDGPSEYFTGRVRIEPLSPADEDINASTAYVSFEPGARSAWHTHPRGQRLIVTAGIGLTQQWGKPVQEIRPGDVVSCPPGVKHWHGATATMAMTHIALTGSDERGNNVTWMEKVSDEQYRAAATSAIAPDAQETTTDPLAANEAVPVAPLGRATGHDLGMLVRVSELEIEPHFLTEYLSILQEEAAASVRIEPGVISIFPMQQQETPNLIRILEVYASRAAYDAHLRTPHFEHYKTTTEHMVKSLRLVDMTALDPAAMPAIFRKMDR